HQTTELTADLAGQEAIVAGMVTGVRRLTTRQGKAFAAVTVEDLGGTAELTIWPDRYEEQEHRLVQGNVLLAKVEVRERGDRLTVAVEELAPYDQEQGRPIEFDPSKFTVTRGARRRGRQRNVARPADGQNGRGPNGAGPGGPNGGEPGPQLRAVPTNGDATANGAASNGGAPRGLPATPAHGPTRLFIAIEETTDVAADRRRIGRILRLIAEHPGDEPAELLVVAGDGTRTLLQLASVSDIDALTAALRPLLGVLGRADRAGGAAEEAPRLAAVGG
ncbi:MAG: OB-fold nucleic acid binding domain-containing protein, partial [Chloroflexota bacterium]|nr:OB-fold nucleic acid binding domain-containing protein [Chloroflexota bacterium]